MTMAVIQRLIAATSAIFRKLSLPAIAQAPRRQIITPCMAARAVAKRMVKTLPKR